MTMSDDPQRDPVPGFGWAIGERESFDYRLREMDQYIAEGDLDTAARALDLMVSHAQRVAKRLRDTRAELAEDEPR